MCPVFVSVFELCSFVFNVVVPLFIVKYCIGIRNFIFLLPENGKHNFVLSNTMTVKC